MGETSLLYYLNPFFIQIWLQVHVDATGENLIQDKIF